MRGFISLLVFLIVCIPATASGQEYTRYRLPEGRRLTVAGQTYQGFDLSEYRELLHMDADLLALTTAHQLDIVRMTELTVASAELQQALNLCNNQVGALAGERDRITALLTEENRRRHEAENAPDLSWIPWAIAGGFAISTVVLAIIVGIQ